jgi:hypothetical protein
VNVGLDISEMLQHPQKNDGKLVAKYASESAVEI